MYVKPIAPVAGGALAATGVYAGTTVVAGIILLIVGLVFIRLAYFRRQQS
ncbi:hypothetical protein ACOCJ7_09955 [Knoellia sp. CPCC 206453]